MLAGTRSVEGRWQAGPARGSREQTQGHLGMTWGSERASAPSELVERGTRHFLPLARTAASSSPWCDHQQPSAKCWAGGEARGASCGPDTWDWAPLQSGTVSMAPSCLCPYPEIGLLPTASPTGSRGGRNAGWGASRPLHCHPPLPRETALFLGPRCRLRAPAHPQG